MSRATRAASTPLIRTTPIPPRPGGVAIATMVSSVLNDNLTFGYGPVTRAVLSPRRDDDRLQKRVADALRRHRRIFGDRQVDETPRVRIERTHFLRAGRLRLLHHETRHLAQFRILALPVIEAVHDERTVVVQVSPKRGVDDLLQRVQRFAPTTEQVLTAFAGQFDPDAVRLVNHRHFERQPHSLHGAAHEVANAVVQLHTYLRSFD